MRRRDRVCPRCHYIGNRHLCGCMGRLSEALRAGDLEKARSIFQVIVDAANADERDERQRERS